MGNHGWGIREMIIYLCIFAILLLFVAISINSLYKKIEGDNDNSKNNTVVVEPVPEKPQDPVEEQPRAVDYTYYHDMESYLYNATYRYLEEKPTETGYGILKIDLDTLVNLGYLNKIYNDIGDTACTGYSNVYVQEGKEDYTIKSYIRCDNYTSEGY